MEIKRIIGNGIQVLLNRKSIPLTVERASPALHIFRYTRQIRL